MTLSAAMIPPELACSVGVCCTFQFFHPTMDRTDMNGMSPYPYPCRGGKRARSGWLRRGNGALSIRAPCCVTMR